MTPSVDSLPGFRTETNSKNNHSPRFKEETDNSSLVTPFVNFSAHVSQEATSTLTGTPDKYVTATRKIYLLTLRLNHTRNCALLFAYRYL